MARKGGSPRKLREIPKARKRSQTHAILQETEISVQIDRKNNVDPINSFDKNFHGQLSNSYKDSIAWLKEEVTNKNNIIAELIRSVNYHNTNTVLTLFGLGRHNVPTAISI